MDLELGTILAYLEIERISNKKSYDWISLSSTQQTYLEKMRQRRQHILASDDEFIDIPSHECSTEKPYLFDNGDFFLSFFMTEIDNSNFTEHCSKLFKHLNDCYKCFDIFCQVLRYYNNTLHELSKVT